MNKKNFVLAATMLLAGEFVVSKGEMDVMECAISDMMDECVIDVNDLEGQK